MIIFVEGFVLGFCLFVEVFQFYFINNLSSYILGHILGTMYTVVKLVQSKALTCHSI